MTFFYDLNKRLALLESVQQPEALKEGVSIDAILARYPDAVENFKQGGDLDYDLESDLYDYYFNRGDIKNYDADASEFISQQLADELGLDEGNEFTGALAQAKASGAKEFEVDGKKYEVEEGSEHGYRASGDDVAGKDPKKMSIADKLKAGVKKVANKIAPDDETLLKDLEKKTIGEDDVAEATVEIPGGRRHTSEPGGYGRKDDDEAPKQVSAKGRGRPKKGADSDTGEVMKPDWSAFGVTGKVNLPKHKGAVTKHKMAAESELDEKAVSQAQRKAAGIAYAAKKGEIPKSELRGASKEMSKMDTKELKKFASTKEKGLPEKKAEVDETTTSGSVATAPAEAAKSKGGISFGQGIYDSWNRELESMIAESSMLSESISVNVSMGHDDNGAEPTKNITVTATGDDAEMLAQMLRLSGMGGHMHSDDDQPCSACGATDCGCNEQVEENKPNWPTDAEYSDDAFQYSGGLNKPKSTGQTTTPVIASQTDRQHSNESVDMDPLLLMKHRAGIKQTPVFQESATPDTTVAQSVDSEADTSLVRMQQMFTAFTK